MMDIRKILNLKMTKLKCQIKPKIPMTKLVNSEGVRQKTYLAISVLTDLMFWH